MHCAWMMNTSPLDLAQHLRISRWGLVLALLTILAGFSLGGIFGAFEDPLKANLAARADEVRDTVYAGDTAKIKSVLDKSWSYTKRAHMHGGGIGTAALGLILLLAALRRPTVRMRQAASLALGVGGLGYSMFWLVAAFRAPGMGGTGLAKEALSWMAIPSAGLLILGLVGVIGLTIVELFTSPRVA